MLTAGQFKINSNINRTTGKAPFNLVLRFRPKIRINIEAAITENSHNALKKTPAARREIELKEKKCESRARYIEHIANNREKVL
jgi:hypothetical protein